MKRKKLALGLNFFIINIIGLFVCCRLISASELFLLTPQEAAHLRFSATQWQEFRKNMVFGFGSSSQKAASDGPRIIIQRPELDMHAGERTLCCFSPVTLEVVFLENKAPVNMRSLEIIAKKGIFSKSLTNRLAPFIQRNVISAQNVEIPAGRYCVEISIADIQGATTVRTYGLQVN